MHRSLRRKLVMVAAALAAIAFAGGAYAATQSSAPSNRQAFLTDVARRLNVTPAQLRSALAGAFDDQLNTAVAQGRLTRAQAAAIERRVRRAGIVPLGARPFFRRALGRGAFLSPPLWLGPLAGAKGKSLPALKASLLARVRRMIHRLVAAKLIPASRAQKLLARLPARIDRWIRRARFRWLFAPRPAPFAPRPIP